MSSLVKMLIAEGRNQLNKAEGVISKEMLVTRYLLF